jgi:hypothetical protein
METVSRPVRWDKPAERAPAHHPLTRDQMRCAGGRKGGLVARYKSRSKSCPVPTHREGSLGVPSQSPGLPGIFPPIENKDPHHRRGSFFRPCRGSFPRRAAASQDPPAHIAATTLDFGPEKVRYLHSAIKLRFIQDQFFCNSRLTALVRSDRLAVGVATKPRWESFTSVPSSGGTTIRSRFGLKR